MKKKKKIRKKKTKRLWSTSNDGSLPTAMHIEYKPIKYLLDDLHQIFQNLSTLADILVCNDGCGQVTQDVGAHGLDGIEVSG